MMQYYDPETGVLQYFDPKTDDFYPIIRAILDEMKKRGADFATATACLMICENDKNMEGFLAWLKAHPEASRSDALSIAQERFDAGHGGADYWESQNRSQH